MGGKGGQEVGSNDVYMDGADVLDHDGFHCWTIVVGRKNESYYDLEAPRCT